MLEEKAIFATGFFKQSEIKQLAQSALPKIVRVFVTIAHETNFA